MAAIRSKNLYFLDAKNDLRFSHENPEIKKVYDEYLEKPLSRMAHKLLHTDHEAWEMPLAPKRGEITKLSRHSPHSDGLVTL